MTPAWHHKAACAGTELDFFSESKAEITKARVLCLGCPVRTECEAEGDGMSWGVWGGTVRHRVKGVA